MKRFTLGVVICIALMFCNFATCQNGPTAPAVNLTWTAAATQPAGTIVTQYCIYRGTTAGNYSFPGVCIDASKTSYVDNTVTRGTQYFYAVTARTTTTEGKYSNEVSPFVPLAPNPPTVQAPALAQYIVPGGAMNLSAKVIWK